MTKCSGSKWEERLELHMTKTIEITSSNTLNGLAVNARSYIKFSNNITSINVVSTLQEHDIDRS